MAQYTSFLQQFHSSNRFTLQPTAFIEPLKGSSSIPENQNLKSNAEHIINQKTDFYKQAFKNYEINHEKRHMANWFQTQWKIFTKKTTLTHENRPLPFSVMFNPKALWVALASLVLGPVGLPFSLYHCCGAYSKWKTFHEEFDNTSPNILSFLKAHQEVSCLQEEAFTTDLEPKDLAKSHQIKQVINHGYQLLNDFLPTLDLAILYFAYRKGATPFHLLTPSLRPKQTAKGWVNQALIAAMGGVALHLTFQNTLLNALHQKSFSQEKSHEEKSRCLQEFFGLCNQDDTPLTPQEEDRSQSFSLEKLQTDPKSIQNSLLDSEKDDVMFVVYKQLCQELKNKVREWNNTSNIPTSLYINSKLANHLIKRLPHWSFHRNTALLSLYNLKNPGLYYLANAKSELGESIPGLLNQYQNIQDHVAKLKEIERGFQMLSQWATLTSDLHNEKTDDYCLDVSLKLKRIFSKLFEEFEERTNPANLPDPRRQENCQQQRIKDSYAPSPGLTDSLNNRKRKKIHQLHELIPLMAQGTATMDDAKDVLVNYISNNIPNGGSIAEKIHNLPSNASQEETNKVFQEVLIELPEDQKILRSTLTNLIKLNSGDFSQSTLENILSDSAQDLFQGFSSIWASPSYSGIGSSYGVNNSYAGDLQSDDEENESNEKFYDTASEGDQSSCTIDSSYDEHESTPREHELTGLQILDVD